jgi:hypothetical protein
MGRYQDAVKRLLGDARSIDPVQEQCATCIRRELLVMEKDTQVRAPGLAFPHVGSNYGTARVPRVVLVGLEDPYHEGKRATEIPESLAMDYLEGKDATGPEHFLKRRPEKRMHRNTHRAGEWEFSKALLQNLCPDATVTNPFPYISTLNGHLCGLKKGSTSTASRRLNMVCPIAWRIVQALEPEIVVVEGNQVDDAKRGLEGLEWVPGTTETIRKPIKKYKERVGSLRLTRYRADNREVVVFFANHPSNRRMPWRSKLQGHPYLHEILLGDDAKAVLASWGAK